MSYDYLVDNLRQNLPPEPEVESPLDRVREFSQWLLVVPMVVAILFGCGQLALITTSTTAYANTRSPLGADYLPWQFLEVPAVRSEIVEEIMSDQDPDTSLSQMFSDPVEVADVWVDESSATDGDVAMGPTEAPSGESGEPTSEPAGSLPTVTGGGEPTLPTEPSITQPPGSTSPPTPTQIPGQTSTPGPTSTPAPSATPGSGPTSTSPPNPTSAPSSTATPPPTSTSPPTATVPPTNTPIPNPTATVPTPPPVNYCANINWISVRATDYEGMGTVIKFSILLKNNNTIPMSLTSYSISWTNNGLSLHRAKAIIGDGTRPKLINASVSSPQSCTGCPVTFTAMPSLDQEIYNMFCKNTNCDEEDPGEPQIPPGTYNFTATGTFTFYGGSTVNCNFNKSDSITMH